MSPVSRKRKKQPSRRPDPTIERLAAEVVASYEDALDASAFDVELFTSDLMGVWWQQSVEATNDPNKVPASVLKYAARQRTPEALAALLALEQLGVDERIRSAAGDAARRLREAGVAEPGWAADLGPVTIERCATVTDVYGEQSTVACAFDRAGTQHAMVALVDHDELGGEVLDAWFAADPPALFDEIAEQAASSDGMAMFADADPAEVAVLLRRGFALQDDALEVPESEEFVQFRALALARLRDMPGSTEIDVSPPDELSDDDLDLIIRAFLDSPEAAGLADGGDPVAVEEAARLLVEYGAEEDERPLRISPGRLDRILHGDTPAEELEGAARDAFPAVIVAWTRYTARLAELTEPAVADLVQIATECGNHVNEDDGDHLDDADADQLFMAYLPELVETPPDELPAPPEVAEMLKRRVFVVPELALVVDGVTVTLDPSTPEDRQLSIMADHPEYAAALAGDSEDTIDGVNPLLHVTMHEIVANQLWHDEPAEAWQAARRLLDADVDRMDILHALGDVALRHAHGPDATQDETAYLTDLNALGR